MKVKQLGFLAGIIGPVFFGIIVTSLTLLEYDYLRTLGWHPLYAPTRDWPRGLALGPYGLWMTLTFIVSGSLTILFALALGAELKPARSAQFGSAMLASAGLAVAGLAFPTDPTIRLTPATWHGRLHDLSFVLLGFSLLPAMLLLGAAFRHNRRWRNLSSYSWLTVVLAIPAFILKGISFYIFLLAVLVWSETIALRLKTKNSNQKKG